MAADAGDGAESAQPAKGLQSLLSLLQQFTFYQSQPEDSPMFMLTWWALCHSALVATPT